MTRSPVRRGTTERPDEYAGHPSPRCDSEVTEQFRLLIRCLTIITARPGEDIAGVNSDLALSGECGALPGVSGYDIFAEQAVAFLCKLGLSRDEHVSTALRENFGLNHLAGVFAPSIGRSLDLTKNSSETPDLRAA